MVKFSVAFCLLAILLSVTANLQQSWMNSLSAVANLKVTFEQSVADQEIFDESNCDELFSTPTQRRICHANVAAGNAAGLVAALDAGVRLAIKECKEQFKGDRWNCPIEWEPSLWPEGFSPESVAFLQQGTKESAFMVAAISAALTHTVAYACSIGNLTDCSCQQTQQPAVSDIGAPSTTTMSTIFSKSSLLSGIRESSTTTAASAWQWGGCSENVQFGSFLSRKFLDPQALERIRTDSNDLLALVQLQNLQFGRKTLTSQMRVNCRCHGLSASCSVKTCFRQPSPFRQVAIALREKYERALLASERPELKAAAVVASSASKTRPVAKPSKPLLPHRSGEDAVESDDSAMGDDSPLLRNRLIRRKAKEDSKQSFVAASSKQIMAFLRSDSILRDNLIHFKKSPNFCEPSAEWPHGTTGRACSRPVVTNPLSERLGMVAANEAATATPTTNSTNVLPSCDTLCCGRGFDVKLIYTKEPCRCVFKWCCEVVCEDCWTTKEVLTCK